ncbi:putative ribonuclease H-like domain-containing protein [Tanacetum coccineum]
MREELLQFKLQEVWTLLDLPNSKRPIGKIEEEVYICQPPGFEDPNFPDRVYKVENALYGLHQAPRAWYETLSTYLLDNGFQRGKIDKTLFIRRDKSDILLVQVYVDDIIFGSTKKSLCIEFEKMMHKKFQMSSMGELTFFLGLQVKQKEDGIFISQDKYVTEILKKFGFTDVKTTSTPMETQKHLLKEEDGEEMDVHLYRSMIGSLMYMFTVCACERYQVNLKVSHLHAVKKIFRYLKGQPKLGLWYQKNSPFDLVAYTDSDYAGARIDRKSTTGGCQFLGCRLISLQCKKQTVVANSTTDAEYVAASSCCGQIVDFLNASSIRYALTVNPTIYTSCIEQFWSTVKAKMVNEEVQLQALVNGKKIVVLRGILLDLEKTKTAQAQKITSLKLRVKRLEKKGGSRTHKLKRLYKVSRSTRVVSSDEASLGDQEDASKQGRKIDDIDVDAEITLVDETQGRHDDDLMFDIGVLNDEEVFAGQDMAEKEVSIVDLVTTAGEVVTTANVKVSTTSPTVATITNVELTLA